VIPQVFHSILEIRDTLKKFRAAGESVGLVPTMGALHAGHGQLIETARRECDRIVASIFVNPIQFNRADDYDLYPRTLSSDVEFCAARNVDLIFAPSVDEMYPRPQRAFVDVTEVSDHLCGKFRPGHFRGVATVVMKLLNIVQPDRAYFGEKDAQQVAIIQRMCADLNVPVQIVEVPTVREMDGLALSSRNQRLSATERLIAPVLHQALKTAEELIANGATDAREVKREAMRVIERNHGLRMEYFEIVSPGDMQPVETVTGPVRVAGAIWIGETRLIDNVLCVPGRTLPAQAAIG